MSASAQLLSLRIDLYWLSEGQAPIVVFPSPDSVAKFELSRLKELHFSEGTVGIQEAPKVFVVDDDVVIASTVAAILRLSGFTATAYINPLEALAAVAVEAPQLIISDVLMPELSGVDLAIRVQEIRPDCKVLLFSGQAATADLLKEAREKGHDFVLLTKPVHPNDLLAAIRSMSEA